MDNDDNPIPPFKQRVHDPKSYAFNGKIMLCSVIILFFALLVMFCLNNKVFRFFRSHRRRRSHHGHSSHPTTSTATPNDGILAFYQGLDVSIIKTIPTFVYSSKIHDRFLECAVCLSEFEEDERGRVLPKCNHTFHVYCIDMWFSSHSSCPLCRAPVQAQPDTHEIRDTRVAISVAEPAGSVSESNPESCQSSEDEMDGPSPPTPATSQAKSFELVGVCVEEPKGDSDSGEREDGLEWRVNGFHL